MGPPRMRKDPVAAQASRDKERGGHPKWHGPLDASVAYSPWVVGLATGVAGVLMAPNRALGVVSVGAGMSVGAVGTFWDRYKKRKESKKDAH